MGRYMPPQKHRWLDQWKGSRTQALDSLIAQATTALEARERSEELRLRKRREEDARRFRQSVAVLVSNLAHAVVHPPESGRLAFGIGNGDRKLTRYDNPALGKAFTRTFYAADALGMLDLKVSTTRGEASSFAPTERFTSAVRAAGITLDDFHTLGTREVIILSKRLPAPGQPRPTEQRVLLPYTDDAQTDRMRDEVKGINTRLHFADITFQDDGLGVVDHQDRSAARHFCVPPGGDPESFDYGGRLFGGFWQNLNKARRGCIRIEREPVALLDFASMFSRLAYAMAGTVPPAGDIYAIPGLEGHRAAVKAVFSAFLFDPDRSRHSWPDSLIHPTVEGQDPSTLLPASCTVKWTRAAILKRHPGLADSFGRSLGFRLMMMESRIIIAVLGEMKREGMVGLGIHDGMLVKASDATKAKAVMEEVGEAMTMTHIPVTVSTLP